MAATWWKTVLVTPSTSGAKTSLQTLTSSASDTSLPFIHTTSSGMHVLLYHEKPMLDSNKRLSIFKFILSAVTSHSVSVYK